MTSGILRRRDDFLLAFLFYGLLYSEAVLQKSENDFRFISYKDLQQFVDTFADSTGKSYSKLLFDVARNQVLVGARDVLYRLSLPHLNLLESAPWLALQSKSIMCLNKGQTEENCHNYIKVLLTNGSQVFVCGTGAFSPICQWREMENINSITETVDGRAKCPYHPHSNITSLLTETGDYYVGGPTDFSGTDFAIYRSIGADTIRSQQYNSMLLNEPQFVGSFQTERFVYFLFREAAVEYINCGKIIYSRIARVCKSDGGGGIMLKDKWTTFIKARLNCSIPGDYPFYFDEIQGTAYLEEEQMLYATFATPANSISGSAICTFNMTAINEAFAGPFKHQEHVGSAWHKVQRSDRSLSHFECTGNIGSVVESSKYHLVDKAVQQTTLAPLFRTEIERFTHITVDRRPTKAYTNVHVIFVATQDGLVKKISVLGRTRETCIVEVWQPVNFGLPNNILTIEFLRTTESVYIGTTDAVLRIPTQHCQRHVSRDSCINAMDPYCGWNELADVCTSAPNSDPLDQYWKQSLSSCPILNSRIDGGWGSWSAWEQCGQRGSTSNDAGDECLCQSRICNNPAPKNGGTSCTGHSIAVTNCTIHGGWTAWSAWSECSASCGIAVKTRMRTCTNPTPAYRGRVCVGQDRSEVTCTNNPPCPVSVPTPQDGGWGSWSVWSACSVECGRGYKKRTRICDSPLPRFAGADCSGTDEEYEMCSDSPCVRYMWTPWSIDSEDETLQRRFKYVCRIDTSSQPKLSLLKNETRPLSRSSGWSLWGAWGECNATCDTETDINQKFGYQTRKRICELNQNRCSGSSIQSRSCTCHTNMEWSCWTEWSPCSVSCGWGIRRRIRTCNSDTCRGENSQQEPCEALPCHSLLGWKQWSAWSECDKNNEQHRRRRCSTANPGPQICHGADTETRLCIAANEMPNDISMAVAVKSTSVNVGLAIGLIAFLAGAACSLTVILLYSKRRKPRLPSSPHYMSAKQNPYISVPFQERPVKRQTTSTSSNMSMTNQSHMNGTLKSLKYYDYDTIKRNSHNLSNCPTKTDILDDKYYE